MISRRDDETRANRHVEEEQRRNQPFFSFPAMAGEFRQASSLLVENVPQRVHISSSRLEACLNSLR